MRTDGAPPAARLHPLVELTRVRLLEFVREPEAVFWVFVFPVLLALALGVAFRGGATDSLRVAVVGETEATERVQALLAAVDGLEVVPTPDGELERALAAGRVDLVVEVAGLGAAEGLVYRFDALRPAGRASRLLADAALQEGAGRTNPLPTGVAPIDGVGQRYIDFLIPGLVGLNLMGSGVWGLGFPIVVARTRKLLKRFAATGMRRSHFLASFIVSRLVFLALEVAAILGFGVLVFGVPMEGSWTALAVVSITGALSFAAIGLLVAARPTTIEGVSGWMNLVQLPMWLLSGTFFPYERFPEATHLAIRALPLTALNDALRAVVLDGRGLLALSPELAVMALWGGVGFVLALRLFRWQ